MKMSYDNTNDVHYIEPDKKDEKIKELEDALLEVRDELKKQGKFMPKIKLGGEK